MLNYLLRNASIDDKQAICNYKIDTIVRGNEISDSEKEKISKYINESLIEHLKDYKIIMVEDEFAGIFCMYLINNGHDYLLDEIYLIDKYRKKGIATSLVKNSIKEAQSLKKDLYLWVYKSNTNAINIYKKSGFKIVNETDTRYQMVFTV